MYRLKQIIKMLMQNVLLPLVYCVIKVGGKKKEKFVIFADSSHNSIPMDFVLLKEMYLLNGYEVGEHYCDFKNTNFIKKVRVINSFYRSLAQTNLVIICNYYLPVSSPTLKNVKVIQLWHGCGYYKKFGHDAEDDISKYYHSDVCRNYSLVSVSSEQCKQVYSKALQLDINKVKSLGVSRTDLLFDKEYKSIALKEFELENPNSINKKIILWAPTFRGKASDSKLIGVEEMKVFQQRFKNEYYIITKIHPMNKNGELRGLNESNIDIMKLVAIADYLISDYSSVIFEFALMKKPIILFIKDYYQYTQDRGFYLDLFTDLPFESCQSLEGLEKAFKNIKSATNYDGFLEIYMKSCDGNSTKRIYKYIEEEILNG